MGKINLIWPPLYWKTILEGINRDNPSDIVYEMIIGEGEDESYYEITEFISKENYENIINNKYKLEVFPYSEIKVILFDENGAVIPLVKEKYFDFSKLNEYQKGMLTKHYSNLEIKQKIRKK